jgi:HAD superfamily hydrolase (TIGR01509 family)
VEARLLKALIFDFDGLILDTETPEMEAWHKIYQDHGALFSVQAWGQIVGGAGVTNFEPAQHLESLLGHPIDRESVRQQARRLSDAAILQQPVLPGARGLLAEARERAFKLAIASSSPHDWVDNHLKRLDMFACFDAILCADDVTRTKPDPGLFLAALQALQVQSKEAVVFEDSPNGILAANLAGIFSVAVPNPLTIQLDIGKADLILHSLEQVSLENLKVRLQ